ncbi:alpha/beta hydrolase [Thermobrachium celere]|uniref:Putative alpha-dextrin endo-1, 6-alpha-glucosidase n=1 Tax=Thermobrachium celere DSM 8682 TaxID=941824 RepID=R7RUT3_9CLOT|nr:alpha/beta hydrolase-fold protein [Thermobrachium celere]CDF59238.1 putative alpha-dextrin endo-1, 6-alpha-glucosidase [Thermobrachium celere DSM 8682]
MERIEIREIYMKELDRKRNIRVYLPIDYYDNKNKRYPVIYMHDGQNLFDHKLSYSGHSWEVKETLDRMQQDGKIEGFIVVGIDNNQEGFKRLDEYSPWKNEEIESLLKRGIKDGAGGEGDKYAQFIVNTLKPYIDEHYRTLQDRDNTIVAGSSMGAFISLYIGFKYQEIFSKIGAFSTAAWFKEGELIEFLRDEGERIPMRVYLDIGTEETSNDDDPNFKDYYINGTIRIYETLSEFMPKERIKLIIDEGAKHSEIYWAKRFPEFINFIK